MYACVGKNQESHTDAAQQQIMGIWLKLKEPFLKQSFVWLVHRRRWDGVDLALWVCLWVTQALTQTLDAW